MVFTVQVRQAMIVSAATHSPHHHPPHIRPFRLSTLKPFSFCIHYILPALLSLLTPKWTKQTTNQPSNWFTMLCSLLIEKNFGNICCLSLWLVFFAFIILIKLSFSNSVEVWSHTHAHIIIWWGWCTLYVIWYWQVLLLVDKGTFEKYPTVNMHIHISIYPCNVHIYLE